MADLRAGGDVVGGPAPFAKADRSRFLQALDEALVRLARCGLKIAARERKRPRPFMTGNGTFRTLMQTQNIIERAFQLARGQRASTISARPFGKKAMYVDAHLGGASIKADLKKRFAR